jgi:hypothetical protein
MPSTTYILLILGMMKVQSPYENVMVQGKNCQAIMNQENMQIKQIFLFFESSADVHLLSVPIELSATFFIPNCPISSLWCHKFTTRRLGVRTNIHSHIIKNVSSGEFLVENRWLFGKKKISHSFSNTFPAAIFIRKVAPQMSLAVERLKIPISTSPSE